MKIQIILFKTFLPLLTLVLALQATAVFACPGGGIYEFKQSKTQNSKKIGILDPFNSKLKLEPNFALYSLYVVTENRQGKLVCSTINSCRLYVSGYGNLRIPRIKYEQVVFGILNRSSTDLLTYTIHNLNFTKNQPQPRSACSYDIYSN